MKNKLIVFLTIVILVFIGIGIYMFDQKIKVVNVENNIITNDVASTTPEVNEEQKEGSQVVIGRSIEGNNIIAYNYGTGDTRILFIGGIHGGYSWNTALLGFETMDYLKSHLDMIPSDIIITVIPVLNPDGLQKAVGTSGEFSANDVSKSQSVILSSRTNANEVDINRNFDCKWQSDAVWQKKSISGGESVFSEPESQAIKNYIENHKVSASVVWYSAVGGVYSSKCGEEIMSETNELMNVYAKASGYPANDSYDYYETTGDLVNWLAKEKIPAVSVLLTNHTDTELDKNIKGIKAVIDLYSKI